jgi:predicted AlkP superfamily pyrophosphatase or phosphodiesterase
LRQYDASVPNAARVDQALAWLRLPESERPRLVMLYFSAVDSAAHRYGPLAPQTKAAALEVDAAIGRLREGLAAIGRPTNLIVVSDHGMAATDPTKAVWLDEVADLSGFIEKGDGPQASLYLRPRAKLAKAAPAAAEAPVDAPVDAVKALQAKLRAMSYPWRAWLRAEIPERLHDSANPRVGDLLIDMDPPWSILLRSRGDKIPKGNHGWDPSLSKDMHGTFIAEGPAFRRGARVGSFENVEVFPLLLRLLEVPPERASSQARATERANGQGHAAERASDDARARSSPAWEAALVEGATPK